MYLVSLAAVRQHDDSRRSLLVNHGPEVGHSGRQRRLGRDEAVWAPVALRSGGGGETNQSVTTTATVDTGGAKQTRESQTDNNETYANVGGVDVLGGSVVFLI